MALARYLDWSQTSRNTLKQETVVTSQQNLTHAVCLEASYSNLVGHWIDNLSVAILNGNSIPIKLHFRPKPSGEKNTSRWILHRYIIHKWVVWKGEEMNEHVHLWIANFQKELEVIADDDIMSIPLYSKEDYCDDKDQQK